MPDSLLARYHQNSLAVFCSAYWIACDLIHRRRDLEQLVQWATRKKLNTPQQYYTRLLLDLDQRLWYWHRRAPHACAIAEFAVGFANLFAGKPKFYKGYTKKFNY